MSKIPWGASDWGLFTFEQPVTGRWITRLVLVLKDGRWIRCELMREELKILGDMAYRQLAERSKRLRKRRKP